MVLVYLHDEVILLPMLGFIFQHHRLASVCVCVSKPIIINVSEVNTTINPSYFDVHQDYKVLTQSHLGKIPPQSVGWTLFQVKLNNNMLETLTLGF